MNHSAKYEEVRAVRAGRERVANLLERYPEVSGEETGEILTFLRTGRHLDIGLLTSNDRLRPKLDAFMEVHKAHFRVKWSEGALLVGAIVAGLVILWLALEAFA